MTAALLWFRRDLRLRDHPALAAASSDGEEVLACFVLDPRLEASSGPRRLQFLGRQVSSYVFVTNRGTRLDMVAFIGRSTRCRGKRDCVPKAQARGRGYMTSGIASPLKC